MTLATPAEDRAGSPSWDNSALRARLGGAEVETRSIEAELRLAIAERLAGTPATRSSRRRS
jgi:hypothetical protein